MFVNDLKILKIFLFSWTTPKQVVGQIRTKVHSFHTINLELANKQAKEKLSFPKLG